jgi:hypothetical protein
MINTTFDIVEFIEKNPLSRLNIEYQNALINKIKSEFNHEEQKLFVTSFYCYLNFNPLTDFVIDFEDIWKWCGFSRKDHAKRILDKHFAEDIDYKVALPNLGERRKNEGGFNKEKITLNIRTFKKYCLKSNTDKSNEIHNYYIKLEEILQETLLEQTDELQMQLEKSHQEIKALTKKYIKPASKVCEDQYIVYLMTTDEGEKVNEYVVGKTMNLKNRKEGYDSNKLHDFKVIYYKVCNGIKAMDILEAIILIKLGKYRCKAGRDVFLLPTVEEGISTFTNIFDECIKFFEDVEETHIVFPGRSKNTEYNKEYQNQNKEEISEKNKEYRDKNKEKIAEKQKEYRDQNKEELAEKKKKYYEANKEEISEKHKEYCEANKEELAEKRKEYYDANKEKSKEKSKKYRDENKEKIAEKRKKYYKANKKEITEKNKETYEANKSKLSEKVICECGSEVAKSSMTKHKKTPKHVEQMKLKL